MGKHKSSGKGRRKGAARRGRGWFGDLVNKGKELVQQHGSKIVAAVRDHGIPLLESKFGNNKYVGAISKANNLAKKHGFGHSSGGRRRRVSQHAKRVGALIRRTGMSLGAASRAVKKGRSKQGSLN